MEGGWNEEWGRKKFFCTTYLIKTSILSVVLSRLRDTPTLLHDHGKEAERRCTALLLLEREVLLQHSEGVGDLTHRVAECLSDVRVGRVANKDVDKPPQGCGVLTSMLHYLCEDEKMEDNVSVFFI